MKRGVWKQPLLASPSKGEEFLTVFPSSRKEGLGVVVFSTGGEKIY